jgi:hypothetical protein
LEIARFDGVEDVLLGVQVDRKGELTIFEKLPCTEGEVNYRIY